MRELVVDALLRFALHERVHELETWLFWQARSQSAMCDGALKRQARSCTERCSHTRANFSKQARELVEPDGIEPTTSCLQSRRSPN